MMKLNKRMPLLGAMFIIFISAFITINFHNIRLNTIVKEQTNTINNLTHINTELNQEIEQLTKENEQLKKEKDELQKKEDEEPSTNEDTTCVSFKITGYCNCSKCCGQWADGQTKTGTTPTEGRTIAVDPNVIPLGSKVIINGHTYIAEDTGSSIKGNRIDMYFESHQDALDWGIQYEDVIIVEQ